MNKLQYSIGINISLSGEYSWMLVPMGMVGLKHESIGGLRFYKTAEEARSAAKVFVGANQLELYSPPTPKRKFSPNDSVVVVDKKCITCDKEGWVECYDGPDNSKVKVGFDHGWVGWYNEEQLEKI